MRAQHILNDKKSGLLTITWDDATQQQFGHALLRSNCQCADCKKKRDAVVDVTIQSDIQLTEIHLVGTYGIQLVFNDGHDRGIFPWDFLRKLTASTIQRQIKETR